MDTNGEQLMRSAHSSRLSPFHTSNYKVSRLNESNMSGFVPKSNFQKLGKIIQKQTGSKLADISNILP